MPSQESSASFYKTELEQALSEQTFGIRGYNLGMFTAYDARATVDLLERVQIDVILTIRGFRVRPV